MSSRAVRHVNDVASAVKSEAKNDRGGFLSKRIDSIKSMSWQAKIMVAVGAGLIAALVATVIFIKAHRRRKESELERAKLSAAENASYVAQQQASPLNDETIPQISSEDELNGIIDDSGLLTYQIDTASSSIDNTAVTPSPKTQKTIILWTLANPSVLADSISKTVVQSLVSIYSRSVHPTNIFVVVWYYSANEKIGEEHRTSTCPLLSAYRNACAEKSILSYANNITCIHRHHHDWKGRSLARYEAMSSVIAAHEAQFLLLCDERCLMVQNWDERLYAQWVTARESNARWKDSLSWLKGGRSGGGAQRGNAFGGLKSPARDNVSIMITCCPPTEAEAVKECKRIHDNVEDAIQANQLQTSERSASNTTPSTASSGDNGVGGGHRLGSRIGVTVNSWMDNLVARLSRSTSSDYISSINYILDTCDFLPGTWTCFSHWTYAKDSFILPSPNAESNFFHKNISDAAWSEPLETPWYSSRFAFAEKRVFMRVPDDPMFVHCKIKHDIDWIQSVRLWTNGVDFYHPTTTLAVRQSVLQQSSVPSSSSVHYQQSLIIPKLAALQIASYLNQIEKHGHANSALGQSSARNDDLPPMKRGRSKIQQQSRQQHQRPQWIMFGSSRSVLAFLQMSAIFPASLVSHCDVDVKAMHGFVCTSIATSPVMMQSVIHMKYGKMSRYRHRDKTLNNLKFVPCKMFASKISVDDDEAKIERQRQEIREMVWFSSS